MFLYKDKSYFNSKFDLDIADFNESDVLSPNNRNMYNWEKAFIFEIGKNFLSVFASNKIKSIHILCDIL